MTFRGRSGISFKGGGSILGLQEKRGVQEGGPTLGPMLKGLYRGPKRGGLDPDALPPGSAHDLKTFRSVGGESLLLLYGIH